VAPIPTAHKAHPRFAGNRCNDNRPMPMAGSSTRTVSRRKRIHQLSPYSFLCYSVPGDLGK